MKDFIKAYFYNLANLVSLYTAVAIFTVLRFFKVGEVYE
jgi:hypothetical protein